MGAECTSDERETRYREFHNALHIIEKDIMKDLMNSDISKKKYISFGLINKGLLEKYKFLSKEVFDGNKPRNKIFDYKYLVKKTEHRNFKHINKLFCFYFPSDFMFVTKDFLDVISIYIDQKYVGCLEVIFNSIIGGDCIIMKDAKDLKDEKPYRYIILYHEIKENQGNEIDFFLSIKDKNEREKIDNFILKYDLWSYFKKIKYDYRDELKN